MGPRSLLGRGRTRRLIPLVVVGTVAAMVVVSAAATVGRGSGSFGFQLYFQAPQTYVPGVVSPTAYLQINYTGPGVGRYTYILTSSDSAGAERVLQSGVAIVSSSATFRDFVFLNVTGSATVSLQMSVYAGSAVPKNLLYQKTLTA